MTYGPQPTAPRPPADHGHGLIDVVIPTIGRPQLATLLQRLGSAAAAGRIIVVDDRPAPHPHLPVPEGVEVVRCGGRGPAAARNAGWTIGTAPWVVFLDDDVVPTATWWDDLRTDLAGAGPSGAVTGRVVVPRPPGRAPTDAERNVIALETAQWITADMAVRRDVLQRVGGFDERFIRAYREDTDLALRMLRAGEEITAGRRVVEHPVRHGTWRSSIGAQRGNADDAVMQRRHGRDWRVRGQAPAGGLRSHVTTTAWLAGAVLAGAMRRTGLARMAGAVAVTRIVQFWWSRVANGPRSVREWGRMALSSAVIPVAATWWAGIGRWRARVVPPLLDPPVGAPPPEVVLFDRDGTLLVDVPYNGDPGRVVPVPGAAAALDRLRAHGVRIGMITNQSGIARGLLRPDQVDAVNRRVTEVLGPFDVVMVCPHRPDDGCTCRKPLPGMVLDAAQTLGVAPSACAVVGDIGTDVDAALAAGSRAVLVPTRVTRLEEVCDAPEVALDLAEVVDRLLGNAIGDEAGDDGTDPDRRKPDRRKPDRRKVVAA
jgi:HAD superfamily hydrolase (TIGR01662 family)